MERVLGGHMSEIINEKCHLKHEISCVPNFHSECASYFALRYNHQITPKWLSLNLLSSSGGTIYCPLECVIEVQLLFVPILMVECSMWL